MAPALTHAPRGKAWRAVQPEHLESQLTELWKEAAREGPVSRALMANLLIVRARAAAAGLHALDDADIVEVARRHPARTIVLNYDPQGTPPRRPSGMSVGVVTFGGPERYGIELIELDAACADASVPSVVRRVIRGSVPTTLWWPGDLSAAMPPVGMLRSCRQLVYDSAAWSDVMAGARAAASTLPHAFAPDLADLNWRRLAPLRTAIVHALTAAPAVQSLDPAAVTIEHAAGHAAAAWLIAAWLGCRLKWKPTPPPIMPLEGGNDLLRVSLRAGALELSAVMDGQRIEVLSTAAPVLRVPVPRESLADAVVAELRSLEHDRCLTDAVHAWSEMGQ